MKRRQGDPEGVGDLEQDAVRRLAFAALDPRQVGAVDAREVGQGFLGDFEWGTTLADGVAEGEMARGADGWHAWQGAGMPPERLRTQLQRT